MSLDTYLNLLGELGQELEERLESLKLEAARHSGVIEGLKQAQKAVLAADNIEVAQALSKAIESKLQGYVLLQGKIQAVEEIKSLYARRYVEKENHLKRIKEYEETAQGPRPSGARPNFDLARTRKKREVVTEEE